MQQIETTHSVWLHTGCYVLCVTLTKATCRPTRQLAVYTTRKEELYDRVSTSVGLYVSQSKKVPHAPRKGRMGCVIVLLDYSLLLMFPTCLDMLLWASRVNRKSETMQAKRTDDNCSKQCTSVTKNNSFFHCFLLEKNIRSRPFETPIRYFITQETMGRTQVRGMKGTYLTPSQQLWVDNS